MASCLAYPGCEMFNRTARAELIVFLIGIFALMLGVEVYFAFRNPQQLHILTLLNSHVLVADYKAREFSNYFGSAPTAIHAFVFSIFTALCFGLTQFFIKIACLMWASIDLAFEFLQALRNCPDALRDINNTPSNFICLYIESGVFDWFDVGSILLGVCCSYAVLTRVSRNSKSWSLE